jgi:very-short-patch-repair endonuclease
VAKLVVGKNDLRTVNAAIAAELHPTKNGTLTAENFTAGMRKKVWWEKECSPGLFHEWEAKISNRTSHNHGCPICANKTILVGYNDLGTTHPVIAVELHPTKNGTFTAENLLSGSAKKILWEKECSPAVFHEWEATVKDRTRTGRGTDCPICANKTVLVGYNDLGTTHPVIAAELHPTKNGMLTAENFTAGSDNRVWWEKECSPGVFHEWDTRVYNRTLNNSGCPICAGKAILVGYNDLGTTHPIIAAELHPTKNGTLTAEDLTAGMNKKIWWEKECSSGIFHEWKATVNSRTLKNFSCTVCSNKTILVGHNDLGTTHPIIAAELHPTKNGTLTEKDLTAGMRKKVWWEKECFPGLFHEWENTVKSRALINTRCAVCGGRTILVGYNDLGTTHPVIAAELHPTKNGTLTAEDLTAGTDKKIWWGKECSPGLFHEWKAVVNNRTMNNSGCPHCSSGKTENIFRESFVKQTGQEFSSSRIKLSRSSRIRNHAQIDMINESLRLVIEYDGAWAHGDNVLYKKTLAQKLMHDRETTEALVREGYHVIRIRNHDASQKLPFVPLDPQYAANVFQITYKSFGKDRDIIEDTVKRIIEEKSEWFRISA